MQYHYGYSLRNVFWDVHTCSRLNKKASTPQKGKKCIMTNVCSFVPIVFTPKKVFSLVSWREQICNWWEIHRSDYDCLCFLMSPLWTPAFISDKSVFSCSFSPASFSSFRCLFRFLLFSRLCLPSILKQSCSAPCVPYPLPWFSCSLVNAMSGVSRDDDESIKGDHWAYYSPVSPTRMHPPWRRRLYLPISAVPWGPPTGVLGA